VPRSRFRDHAPALQFPLGLALLGLFLLLASIVVGHSLT
jgi:hypothetical protein